MKMRSLLLLGLCLAMFMAAIGVGWAYSSTYNTSRWVTSLLFPNTFGSTWGYVTLPSNSDYSGVSSWDPNHFNQTQITAFNGFEQEDGPRLGLVSADGYFVVQKYPVYPYTYARVGGPKLWKPAVFAKNPPGYRWYWYLLPYPGEDPNMANDPNWPVGGIPGGTKVLMSLYCHNDNPQNLAFSVSFINPDTSETCSASWLVTLSNGEQGYSRITSFTSCSGAYLRNNLWESVGLQRDVLGVYTSYPWTPSLTSSTSTGSYITITNNYAYYQENLSINFP
jgi:hypothetical protein